MHPIELLFGLLAAVAVLMTAARRLALPHPIVLVLGGLALGFVPGLPRIALPPDLVLLVFLPPLIFAEALTFSWRDFVASLRPIALLAFGLVLVTTGAVALTAHAIIPDLPWAAALALGAVVAPTDAVAASAVATRLGLPRRIVVILTGESVVNDAVALVVYRLAVVAVVSGRFSPAQGVEQFALSSLGGVAVGLAAGFVIGSLRRRMTPDPPVENTISLLTPFAAYLPAEALHVSGVLAVLATGLYLGRQGPRFMSAATRLQAGAIWEMIDFLLNGLLFILVGLQLRGILDGLTAHHPARLLGHGLLVSLAVILARLAWVFPATYLPRLLSPRLRATDPSPPWRATLIVGWAGMRGGLSLAAALALPLTVGGGQPFPKRDLLVFLTFAVIFSTLIVQGLTLPPLIRRLALPEDGDGPREEALARRLMAEAALEHLEAASREGNGVPPEVWDNQRDYWTRRAARFSAREDDRREEEGEARTVAIRALRHGLIDAQRGRAVGLRDDGTINDTVLRSVQKSLDLEEHRLILEEEADTA